MKLAPMRLGLVAVVMGLLGGEAMASLVTELELNGQAVNNSVGTAQAISNSAFTLPVPSTVFNPPGYATAQIQGLNGGFDVDFFSFQANAGQILIDVDDNPYTFDTILSLFNSNGTLLAYNDDSGGDSGSSSSLDSFIGVYSLATSGTYYLAVSQFKNFASASLSGTSTFLFRPDNNFGGFAVSGATVGDSSFSSNGNQTGSAYNVYISLQNPADVSAVPEPSTLISGIMAALLGLGYGWRCRKRAIV